MQNEIHDVLTATPFSPFRIHLSAGKAYEVSHPDQVILTPFAIHIGVGRVAPHVVEHVHRCALSHVVRIEEAEK